MGGEPRKETNDGPSSRTSRRKQVLSILGCWLINVPNGTRWLLGNLTVYTSSYFFAQGGHSAAEVNTPWTLSIAMVAWSVGVFISAPVVKYLGNAPAMVVGNALFNLGLFLSYLSLAYNSITGLTLAFGVVNGLGNGITETVIVVVASEWAGKRQGLWISIVCASHILGSVANNLVATWYINPDNLKPTVKVGSSMLFAQLPIIQRTGSFFLILFFISVTFHLIGTILIGFKTAELKLKLRAALPCCRKVLAKVLSSSLEKKRILDSRLESSSLDSSDIISHSSETEEKRLTSSTNGGNQYDSEIIQEEKEDDAAAAAASASNMTPRQILKTPTFYSMLLGLSCSELAKIWLFDYYKIFALRTIPNDHFLTNLGTTMALITGLTRPAWGWLTDRAGVQATFVIMSGATAFITAFFYLTPLVDRWLYAAATLLFGGAVCSYSIVSALIAVKLYGKANFSVNFGMISLAYVLTNLMAPPLFQGVLDRWGWFPLLFALAALNATCVLAHLVLVRDDRGTAK